ncbi:DEAD/DEAH box helicase [Lactobacillus delbrueckii subsp. bulgaricus]
MVAVNLDDSQANDKQPLLTATGFSHFANRGNGNKVNVKVGLKQVSELKCNIAECKQHEITGPCRHEIALLQKLVLMIMRENPGEVTDYQADRTLARAEMLEEFDQDALEDVKLLAQHGFGGILADEMGLGKTLQVISLLASQKDQPSLIVAPASLVLNWEAEFKKFAPEMKTLVLSGSKKERSGQLADLTDIDVVITSYDLLKRDIANYEPHTFAYEVIDEAQMIKNPRTAAAKSVSVAKAKHLFALTGTPIENRLSELWSIFNFVMPGFLKSYWEFKKDFESPIVKEDDKDCLNRLSQMVGPFIFRRLKKDVLKDLPDKLEEVRYVGVGKEQRRLYDAEIARLKNKVMAEDDGGIKREQIEILAALTRIREICCDPGLLYEDYKDVKSAWPAWI